jgi:hypothetical protein
MNSPITDILDVDVVVINRPISMPPLILEHLEFTSQGARLGYINARKITNKWRKKIFEEIKIKNLSIKCNIKYTREEKISNHLQIKALLYLYKQLNDSSCDNLVPPSKNPELNTPTEEK